MADESRCLVGFVGLVGLVVWLVVLSPRTASLSIECKRFCRYVVEICVSVLKCRRASDCIEGFSFRGSRVILHR